MKANYSLLTKMYQYPLLSFVMVTEMFCADSQQFPLGTEVTASFETSWQNEDMTPRLI